MLWKSSKRKDRCFVIFIIIIIIYFLFQTVSLYNIVYTYLSTFVFNDDESAPRVSRFGLAVRR